MRRLILLKGLKRSGNHALIEWMKANGRTITFNNAVPVAPILAGVRKLPDPESFRSWLRRQHGGFARTLFGTANKTIVVSLEDLDPEWSLFSTVPMRTVNVLLLRDPFHLFASRIRKGGSDPNPAYALPPDPRFRESIALWKAHARAFLGEGRCRVDLPIYFDHWLVSETYRARIARRLGLAASGAGLDKVSAEGGGSSFDGTAFDGRAGEMRVLDRTELLNQQERDYLGLVERDDEVRPLRQRIVERLTAEDGSSS